MASAEPCSTEVKDCTLKDGLVMFSWKPADGAKEYQLEVKDEFRKHSIIQKNKLTSHEFLIELDEKLRVGKAYMVRVTVVGLDEQLKSTDWKLQIIGGEDVPQNVTATVNQENPYRVANIHFDHPKCAERPHSYVILAVPATGKRKKETFTSANDIKFKYLRSGVNYKFLVQACYKDRESELACSNFVITHQKNKSKYGLVNAINVSGTTIHAEGATGYNIKNVLYNPDKNFGQVINLLIQVKNFSGNKDVVSISWDSPSFNNCQDDYRVWSYHISIRNISGNEVDNKVVDFVDDQYDYKVESSKLDLGYTYTIYVKTFYEDIDEDKNQKSCAVEKSLDTRPCSPESLKSWWENSEIIVDWNSARGAVQYEVQIYEEGKKNPVLTNKHDKTLWRHRFADKLKFGSSYKAVVSAISDKGMRSDSQTEYQIIGGDHVPRNVRATIQGVTDPNTEALVKWLEPEKKPLSYKVTAITDTTNKRLSTKTCETNSFIYTELKSGMEYRFIVTAVHADCESGGCKSNKVKTDPKPTPVKNLVVVSSSPTSISLKWDQVDSEKEGESTEYKVKLVAKDINQKHRLTVRTEKCTVDGLQPGIRYQVIVAGGNSEGFGRYSELLEVWTKLGKPRNVLLASSSGNSLHVSFQNAEGYPDYYTLNLHEINQKGQRIRLVESVQQTSEEYQFQNLESNTRYICGVKASYNNEDGEEIETSCCYTAPARAEILYANAKKLSGKVEFSSNEVEVEWDQVEGCQYEVCFKTLEESIENILSVGNRNSCHYFCEHEGSIYTVQVRSKNQSEQYGEWSDRKIIYLAPPAIKDIIVQREKEDIKMTWSKPEQSLRLDGYFIKVNDEERFHFSDKPEFLFNQSLPATRYTFKICGFITLNDKKIKGRFSLSTEIISKPSQTKITELKICDKNPSSRISISWEERKKSDMYEIIVTSKSLGTVEVIMRQESNLPTQCWYTCQRPGDTYSVAIRCIYLSVSGNDSESKIIQLGCVKTESAQSYPQLKDGRLSMHLVPEHTNTANQVVCKIEYDKEGRIGDSDVYHGSLQSLKSTNVIIKFLVLKGDTTSKRNKREVENLSITRHENVVKYIMSGYCIYHCQKAVFIVMEKCLQTLYQKMECTRVNEVNIPHYVEYIKGICKGLRHLHEAGILHRDLKPDNILFRDEKTPVVSDFGLSKRLPDNSSCVSQSSDIRMINGWRAPETKQNDNSISEAYDIFALGLVIYHILSGGKHAFGTDFDYWWVNILEDKKDLKNLIKFQDVELARDLIETMLTSKPGGRPCIGEVLKHPLFWKCSKKLNFLVELARWMEKIKNDPIREKRMSNANEGNNCSSQPEGMQVKKTASMADGSEENLLVRETENIDNTLRNFTEISADCEKLECLVGNESSEDQQQELTCSSEHSDAERTKSFDLACPTGKYLEDLEKNKYKGPTKRERKQISKEVKETQTKGETSGDLILPTIKKFVKDFRDKRVHDIEEDSTSEKTWADCSKFIFYFLHVYYKVREHYKGKSLKDKDFSSDMAKFFYSSLAKKKRSSSKNE